MNAFRPFRVRNVPGLGIAALATLLSGHVALAQEMASWHGDPGQRTSIPKRKEPSKEVQTASQPQRPHLICPLCVRGLSPISGTMEANTPTVFLLISRLRFALYHEYVGQGAMVMSPVVTIPNQPSIVFPVVELSSIGVYSWLPENNLPPFVISTAAVDAFHQRDALHRAHTLHCIEGGGEEWCTNMTGHESGIGLSTLWQNHTDLDLVIIHGYANWHAFQQGPHTVTALGGMRFKRTHELHPFEVGARYGVTVGDAEVSTEASFRIGSDGGERHFQPSIACFAPVGPLVANLGFQLQLPVNQPEEPGAKLLLGLLWNGRTRRMPSKAGRHATH